MNFKALADSLGKINEAMEAGKEVADPTGWKNTTITANKIALVVTLVITLLKAFDIDLPVNDEVVILVSGSLAGILSAANIIMTIITSKKVGRKPVETDTPVPPK